MFSINFLCGIGVISWNNIFASIDAVLRVHMQNVHNITKGTSEWHFKCIGRLFYVNFCTYSTESFQALNTGCNLLCTITFQISFLWNTESVELFLSSRVS